MFMSVGKGDLVAEPYEGVYESLAHSIWMTLHFWLTQQIIRGEQNNNIETGLITIAKLLYPFDTEMGEEIFTRVRGELLAMAS